MPKPAESVAQIARRVKDAKANGERKYATALRDALHLYEDAIGMGVAGRDLSTLRRLSMAAFVELGGQAEPPARSLKDYDSDRFGPYLGVSGSHTAGPAIRQAALESAKVKSLRLTDPLEVGVAHDAERLGSIGELPVGPDEYREIRLEGMGRILTSTNVGSRVNLRFYGRVPVVWINPADRSTMLESAIESCRKRFDLFLHTPDGRPREAKVHVQFRGAVSGRVRLNVLLGLVAEIAKGKIASPAHHQVVLLARVRKGEAGVRDTMETLPLAQKSGIGEVAIEGTVRTASSDVISSPGLLQYFNPAQLNRLLAAFDAADIRLSPKDTVDTGSVARQLWASLNAARSMGLELGKYGLFPLTLGEADEVIGLIQGWFGGWTAAPAFYIDVPVVLRDSVVPTRDVVRGVKVWLDMVARHHVSVVLIDTVFKSEGRHLLKTGAGDTKGFFTRDELGVIDQYARGHRIHVLWAGGITIPQGYELGRLGVFGLYVTSAVAAAKPVGLDQREDPGLAFEREPTAAGVARVKLVIEAGFLAGRLGREEARPIERLATALSSSSVAAATDEPSLRDEVEAAWRSTRKLRR
jgi:hypothetical protein